MKLLRHALNILGKKLPNAKVIQIGAMDGISFDETKEFLDLHEWKSVLVEPIPELFEKLKQNLAYRKNTSFENSAICEFDGMVDMLTIPKNTVKNDNIKEWHFGMSSIYPVKNEFKNKDFDIQKLHGITIRVPALTIPSLLSKYDIDNVDIFICDAEGYDWIIFNQLDLINIRPKFIRLEFEHLNEEEKSLLIKKLKRYNYSYEISGEYSLNIDAIDNLYFLNEGNYGY